jgi:hypothetical protein
MRKVALAVFLMFVVSTVVSSAAFGKHKYMRTESQTSAQKASESAQSMNDCMTYTAAFKAKGKKYDRADFEKQFNQPVNKKGDVWSYNYDNYTTVVLNCAKGSCHCSCLPNVK